MKKIVVIGGGTGTTAVLSGLKNHEEYHLDVIVSMTDDGGSNAVIRDQFGLLPLSDLRKSIIALSDADQSLLRDIFTFRFDKGEGLRGHTLGNLVMMGLSSLTGSEVGAVEAVSELFGIKGTVIPVTTDKTTLVARFDDGVTIKGEHIIDEPEKATDRKIVELSLDPKVEANIDAITAIKNADIIIAGPGDLYTSTLANIIVGGIAEAIKESNATYIFINNLMTKKGQTHWMKDLDLLDEIEKYSLRKPDFCINHNGIFPQEVVDHYATKNEFPIQKSNEASETNLIYANVVCDSITEKQSGDDLVRSLIRHDADKLANIIHNLISNL